MNFPLAISSWDELEIKAVQEVLASGNFTMGAKVTEFEEEFAKFCGTNFAVMFNSGSSANLALIQALRYSGILVPEIETEILVPAVSWSTTYFPVFQSGFKLRFIDISRDSFNIDENLVEKAITKSTKAIFAVNLLGNPCNLQKLRKIADENSLILFEDNCESLGAEFEGKKAGTYGVGGTYSFFFSHHICTMEGGMVTTDSEIIYQFLKSIRAHGWTRGLPKNNFVYPLSGDSWVDQFRFVIPGYNLRPLEIEAATGLVQLKKFPKFLEMRRKNAEVFQKVFEQSEFVDIQKENGVSSWFGFALVLKRQFTGKRKVFIETLAKNGIETRPIVAGNFIRNPVMQHINHSIFGPLVNADLLHDNGFFIGNHHIDYSKSIEELGSLIEEIGKLNA